MSRPSLATVLALIALAVACGGVAVAAIPGPDGKIHACYGSDMVLKVSQHQFRCAPGTTRLVWNQKGVAGPTGAPGVSRYQVVQAESKHKKSGYHKVKASCPRGRYPLGGGATIHGNTGDKRLMSSMPVRPKIHSRGGWQATGRQKGSTNKSFMRAYAVCAVVTQ